MQVHTADSFSSLAALLTVDNLRRPSIFCVTKDLQFSKHVETTVVPEMIQMLRSSMGICKPQLIFVDRDAFRFSETFVPHVVHEYKGTQKPALESNLIYELNEWTSYTTQLLATLNDCEIGEYESLTLRQLQLLRELIVQLPANYSTDLTEAQRELEVCISHLESTLSDFLMIH